MHKKSLIRDRVHFVTYGDKQHAASRERIRWDAQQSGLYKSVTVFTKADKNRWFRGAPQATLDVLAQPRGGGYWLWKPALLKEMLDRVVEGDIIFYCDRES